MAEITQEQYAQILQIIGNSKLPSELQELLTLNASGYFAVVNTGQDDAKKIAIPLLRGLVGDWDASTNTPTLANGVGLGANVYRVSVSGTRDLGNGSLDYGVDELIYYNGSKWVKLTQSQISDIQGLQTALDSRLSAEVSEEFYLASGVLYLNVSTYRQTIKYTSGSQIFTLDFEPTFFIAIFINGVYLDDDDYIYTSPNQLEILGTMENGDTVKIIYEHFNFTPVEQS